MAKVTIGDGKLRYKKMFKDYEIPLENIAWAYLQEEDVEAKMCCSRASFAIGRLIVIDKDGKKEIFQYEGMDEPKRLLSELQNANSNIAFGFTPENKTRFAALAS